jgi:alkylated DNA repair dioxygenase AlkB
MPAPLRQVADRIEAWLAERGRPAQFNSVLMNYYRDGNDSIGLHADDETQLGSRPSIASVSLGATRTFEFRHRTLPLKLEEQLFGGSLLVMLGDTQEQWRHGIPKEPERPGARINLTFRNTLR